MSTRAMIGLKMPKGNVETTYATGGETLHSVTCYATLAAYLYFFNSGH